MYQVLNKFLVVVSGRFACVYDMQKNYIGLTDKVTEPEPAFAAFEACKILGLV